MLSIAARVACEGKLGKDQDVHGLVAGLFEERRHFRHIGGRIRHMYPEQGTADIDKAIGAVHVLQSFLVLVQEGLAVPDCRKQCRNNPARSNPGRHDAETMRPKALRSDVLPSGASGQVLRAGTAQPSRLMLLS